MVDLIHVGYYPNIVEGKSNKQYYMTPEEFKEHGKRTREKAYSSKCINCKHRVKVMDDNNWFFYICDKFNDCYNCEVD